MQMIDAFEQCVRAEDKTQAQAQAALVQCRDEMERRQVRRRGDDIAAGV